MFIDGMNVAEKEMPGTSIDNAQDYTVGATPYISDDTYFFSGLIYNVKVQPGFVYDSDFEPCDADAIDAVNFLATGTGEVPCN